MADEGSRKKRGADNQLTQDNWEKEEDGDDDAEVRPRRMPGCDPPPSSSLPPRRLSHLLGEA
jgi:hypothetical protein